MRGGGVLMIVMQGVNREVKHGIPVCPDSNPMFFCSKKQIIEKVQEEVAVVKQMGVCV